MGKKAKTGKQRLDTFYKRAKEAGYRARSAFKLIQLDKKYDFLSKSKVCIDLCAAPGSWMQVAKKYMPPASVIVGVDLVPIKHIPNTIGITGDITTEKVRQELKTTLKTWKADLVLHDGAPNVGSNWVHDAYQQNVLVLHSFKLACELLQKGGTFVTKVFRSKDYFSLEYVFRKLFKKVEATKPQASRYESAEIFVICHSFLAPDRIDADFFDARTVFQDVDPEPDNKLNLLKPDKVRRKAIGYEEGATMLYKPLPASRFIHSAEFLTVLQEASALTFDNDDTFKNHPSTTEEILEYCRDIKVLGRRELRLVLNWRKQLRVEMKAQKEANKEEVEKKAESEEEDDRELEELENLQKQVEEIKTEKAKEDKRARKKVYKEKKKLEEKMKLKLVIPGDSGPTEKQSEGLFSLKTLDKVRDLNAVIDQTADEILESSDGEMEDLDPRLNKKKLLQYPKEGNYLDLSGKYYKNAGDSDSEKESEEDDSDIEGLGIKEDKRKKKKSVKFSNDYEDDVEDGVGSRNPLLTDLVGDKKEDKRERKAENWFSKDIFKDLETEADEDLELETAINTFKEQGGKMKIKEKLPTQDAGYGSGHSDVERAVDAPDSESESNSDSDSDDSSDEEVERPKLIGGSQGNGVQPKLKGGKKARKRALDEVGKSLATQMIHSKKAKRDIMDAGWNRYMYGDEALPDWFEKDEKKYNSPRIEVDPADLRMYRDQGKAVDAKSIKKVVEAKARKQRRVKKRLSKAHKKAENVTENDDMNSREKATELQKIYKKAMAPLKKKDKTYVVMKKKMGGKKPVGTKGPYRMVDKRLKKDNKGKKQENKRNRKR